MTDLYGELLSRALNRGAPQGHFAAYITPQEGGALRAMGGGVAPGGGQFMANGIPSFQEAGGVDPGIADPTGPTGAMAPLVLRWDLPILAFRVIRLALTIYPNLLPIP